MILSRPIAYEQGRIYSIAGQFGSKSMARRSTQN